MKIFPSSRSFATIAVDTNLKISAGTSIIDLVRVGTHIVSKVSSACSAESFDSKDLSFFHFLVTGILHERNLFVSMDAIRFDIVTSDVADSFDREDFAVDYHFVAFHDFLNGGANITHSCIDARFLD